MLHVALAAFMALMQQHFLYSGLGGVIAAVVGGIIAAVVARANKRSAPTPAPIPQPTPDRERQAPSGGYGQPAPPTSPARRLYAGPIAFTEPTSPQHEDDDAAPLSTPPTPDDAQSSPAPQSLPIMPSNDRLIADWREREAAPLFQPHSTLWNRKPFARPDSFGLGAASSDEQTAPPVWHVGSVLASDRTDEAASLSPEPPTAQTPLWSTWLHTPATDALSADASAPESTPESHAPIWPSYLRAEE